VGPISVTVRRGDVVEAVHRVHVASTDGIVIGDELVPLLRSTAKPLQAIPFAEAYDDLGDDELAIACASHQAEPAQLEAVRKVLARAGATADDLENGTQDGRPDGKLGHNCSGKHAGMLAACAANGWPFAGYRLPQHPLQLRIRELLDAGEAAVDGCGLPTYALALDRTAALLTRTPPRIADAMRARPELVGGRGADDTDLMRALPGWIAKRGAEGLLCAASPEGSGYAFKVEDGSGRALRPAIAAVLGIEAFASVPLHNSLGETVGAIEVEATP
jgi:L-asparaginase II